MSNRLHLATRAGAAACITEARRPALTTSLNDVSCKHCARDLAAEHLEESSAAAERRRLQRNREAAYQVGLGDVWDYVAARNDTATDRFLRDIVGTIATWLLEDGYRATDPVEAAVSTLFDADPALVATTTDDWYTPRWVFDAAGITFDMDVAAPINPEHRTVPAHRYLTVLDDGLTAEWGGAVWCNPPYSRATPWCDRWAAHPDGMILLPALPEVHWCGVVMAAADAFTLLAVDFHRPDGTRARLRWPNILAGRGSCASAVARVAAADKFAHGAHLVAPPP